MTVDELLEMSQLLSREADLFRAELNDAQPRTTKEQWDAWDCLRDAAAYLRSAAIKLSIHEEKTKS
jgi:hypothetical protein